MAWAISITADGWQQIRDELEKWDEKRLIDAICDDKFEAVLDKAGHHHAGRAADAERKRLEDLPQDVVGGSGLRVGGADRHLRQRRLGLLD